MNIVVVSPAVPHPFGETAARGLAALVSGLAERGARVNCLVATGESDSRVRDAREWLRRAPGADRVTLDVFPLSVRPVALRKWRSATRPFSEVLYAAGLVSALDRCATDGYDALHLEQLWSGWAGVGRPRALLNVYQLEIVDWAGRRLRGLGERKALFQMRRATRRILRSARNVRVVSPRLLDRVREINPRADCSVVPFAIDVSLYPMQCQARAPVIGLLGSMHWLPSRSAAERLISRIWPRVKRRVPDARLLVGGWNARRYLERYCGPDVTLVENLAHPTEFFSRASVLVYAPARGTGMKVKVLESMAYGVPVVTTADGVEGLEYENGVHCHVHEDDDALAEAAVELLTDERRHRELRQAARALVERRYSREPFVERMLDLYTRIQGT